MLTCIVEHRKAVAIKAAATMIVHAKKVSKEVDGNALFLPFKWGLFLQKGPKEEFERQPKIRMRLLPAMLRV